ncbi:diguanylate cyclase domain-containing protein [Rhizobacter sp. LjRoot28]|uniref:diguanylate cyclase domain-containing protein n=1 Tax=Rhizobacter sp. LjRoot28 TaxID=3342309 RepID=UPI003ED0D790
MSSIPARFSMDSFGPERLAKVLDLLLDAICIVDVDGRFLGISGAGERIFGYPVGEMLGRPMIDFVHPADRPRTLAAVDAIVAGHPQPHFENRYVRKNGSVVHIMWSARWSAEEGVRVAVARDVTERRRSEAMRAALYAMSDAAQSADNLASLFDRTQGVLRELLDASGFGVALHDKASDSIAFSHWSDPHAPMPAPGPLSSGSASADVMAGTGPACWSHAGLTGPAGSGWTGLPLSTARGVIGFMVVRGMQGASDVALDELELLRFVALQLAAAMERKQRDAWLEHVAGHDALTDLPNRSLLHEHLVKAAARARRDGSRVSLLFVDLDRFKQVNDVLGHAAGDALLQEVARRLRACVREADIVGRLGGDEFVVLLTGLHASDDALAVAEKIRLALGRPCDLAGTSVAVTPSIGIAHSPEIGADWDDLLRRADAAMYGAKQCGGDAHRVAPGPQSAG